MSMDADSSYGGSDTAQDSTLGHDSNSLETSNAHDEVDKSSNEANTYFKNEVTLPINYNGGEEKSSLPHYLSTAKLNIEESVVDAQQLDDLSNNYSSTQNLNAESPKSKNGGIDNPAYEDDGKIQAPPPSNGALKSTFDENKTYTNGDLNTSPALPFSSPVKNDDQMAEAVNLELINLKPSGKDVVGGYGGTNGINDIPIKKETEVEIGNPYDEYFVPVNEHRKYMRGEKLYVTKDKRDKKTRNKCLCWSICLVFVAAAVIVGILAAVGIIGNQEAQPVQGARQFGDSTDSEKTKTKSGGLFGIGGGATENSPPFNNYPPTSEPTVVTMANLPPTTDTSNIEVPRALESHIVIDNLQFSQELAHKNSSEFRSLAENVEKQLMKALFSDNESSNGKVKINLKVLEFMPGSVVVKYRISWTFTDENEAKDPIDKEMLNQKLVDMLDNNFGYLDDYHIPESTISTAKIINMCQINNNGCEGSCTFDYENNDFKCGCPIHMHLNADGKSCMNVPVTESPSSTEPDTITDFVFEQSHIHHHEQGRSNDAAIYAEPEPEPEPEPKPEPEPEPEPELKPTTQASDHNHAVYDFENVSVEPEPDSSENGEDDLHLHTVQAHPESTPKPESNTQRDLSSHANTEQFNISQEPEPTVKPDEDAVNTHHMYYDHQNAGTDSEHTVKPTTTMANVHGHTISYTYDHINTEPEPTGEPEPESNQTTQSDLVNHLPQLTVKPEPEPESTTEHDSIEPEPTIKPEVHSQEGHVHVVSDNEPEPTTIKPEVHSQEGHVHVVSDNEPETTIKPEVHSQEGHVHVVSDNEPETTIKPEVHSQEGHVHVASDNEPELTTKQHTVKPEPAPEESTMKTETSTTPKHIVKVEPEFNVDLENTWSATSELPTATDQTELVPVVKLESSPSNKVESSSSKSHIDMMIPVSISTFETTEAVINTSHSEVINTPTPSNAEGEQVTEKGKGVESNTQQDMATTSESKSTMKMNDQDHLINVVVKESSPEPSTTTTMKVEEMMVHVTVSKTQETTMMPDGNRLKEESNANEIVNLIPTTTEMVDQDFVDQQMTMSPVSVGDESSTNINENYVPYTSISIETTTNAEMDFMTTVKQDKQETVSPEMTISPLGNMGHDTENTILHAHEEMTTEKSNIEHIPVVIVGHSHVESTEHTTYQSSKDKVTEKAMDMFSSDSTENVHNFDNMSPFLPDIDNDTLINNLHSDIDGFTDHLHHINESEMYSSSENPPRLDKDEMNETNPRDRNPADTVLSVLPLDDNDTFTSNEILNKVEQIPINKPMKVENVEVNETETMPPKPSHITLSPDIINNVHSNNYFLKLQTSTEAEYYTKPFSQKDAVNNVSTEDLIAQETTTNKLRESTTKNATMVSPETTHPATENVYVIDERIENNSEVVHTTQTAPQSNGSSTEPHQYQVHENLSEDITTTGTFLKFSTTESPSQHSTVLPSVIPLLEDNKNVRVYDPRELPNDINDDGKFSTDQKDVGEKMESRSKPEMEQAPFTSPPHVGTEVSEEYDFYLQNIKNATTSDVKPVIEGFTIGHFSRCASGQFQCANGTAIRGSNYCISENDRCDSVDDCTDASDEVGCMEEKCLQNFQCKNGQCLKRLHVCNGISDCIDGSDEADCESWTCRFDEFSCGKGGRCVPLSLRCDGRKDCPKGEDEHGCYSQQCRSDEYRCSDKETCIPASWRCDGEKDCMEGDDESLCDCAFDQFKCIKGGGCIPKNQTCDGIEQCPDFSDEWNCFRLQEVIEHTNYLEIRSQNMSWLQVCSSSWNSSYSDMVCQSLGFAGSSSTEFIKLNDSSSSGYYTLNELASNSPLLSQLEQVNDCDSVVSITCQDFECGSQASSDAPSARIIGGDRASETQWPSVVLLYNIKRHIPCTSTVISPNWVVASYSCVSSDKYLLGDVTEWVLYAGGSNVSANATQVQLVRKIIPHPQAKYMEIMYSNDIALIQLDTPLHLGRNVSAICLPDTEIEPRQLCVTAGWGVKLPGESDRQEYLHYLPVPTLETANCNSSEHYNGRLTKDKVCAGYTDTDRTPCYNDEGAPLMCFSESSNTWELQGVLSHHANCGRNRHPPLYTSVNREIREWITNTTGIRLTTRERLSPN